MSRDLYHNFARIVKSFSPDTSAADVAEQYVAMTYSEQNGTSDFMYCESNTWKLLSILAKSENKSSLYRYATIRQWVSKVPADQHLLEKIKEEHLVDAELEEELNSIVRKNRTLRPHPEEKPSKIRRRDDNVKDETLFEKRYNQLRSGDLTAVNSDKSPGYLFNEYIKYSKIALEHEYNVHSKINLKERLTWRECVQHMSKNELLGRYGKALYYTLCGNIPELCKIEGQTWEDIIWAYLNGRVEDMIDKVSTKIDPILSDNQITHLALQKDEIMNKNDPRILFHHIQSAILSDTTLKLIQSLYQGYVKNQWEPKLCVTEDMRSHLLRFVSTLILYGREYLGWIEDPFSTALLKSYAKLNANPETFRPVVVASYAAKLSPPDQICVFSEFLEHFDGDKDECLIILKLGKEYGLDMNSILKEVNVNLLKKAIPAPSSPPKEFEITTGDDGGQYDLYFRAIHWLLLDGNLVLDAVQSANQVIRCFLASGKIHLVKQVFELVPESVYERIVLLGERVAAIIEFDLHRQIMLIFTKYKAWDDLIQTKPMDSGSLEDLQEIYKWRDEVERQTVRMESYMTTILEGDWLGLDSIETKTVSKSTLRQIYIPEILIRYHHLLYSSSSIVPKNQEKCKKMNTYITCQQKELFNDIVLSKRMPDVLEEFSKSLAYF